MKKRSLLILSIFVVLISNVFAQEITTASAYFKTISEYYLDLRMFLRFIKQESAGKISYKNPDLLRMDYTNPEEQVIVFNGDMLVIYLPGSAAVLQQQVSSTGNAATLATGQGLGLLSRYYTVAYETGQNAEPLEEGSDEMVVKFILSRKTASEAFRYIKIAVNPTSKLIRRIIAVTPKNEEFVLNFYDYKLNQNITEQRFIYDPPSSANNYNNFLFTE